MAKYYGTFSCGHEGVTDIVGPTKDRQWQADRYFDGVCPACYAEKIKADNEAARAQQELNGIPPLKGSEKQIAWANKIRDSFLSQADSLLKAKQEDDESEAVKIILAAKELALRNISASWWIDNRFTPFKRYVYGNIDEITAIASAFENKLDEATALEESVIKPEDCTYDTPAEISTVRSDEQAATGKVEVRFIKDDLFRSVVKKFGCVWDPDNRCWWRSIGMRQGSIEDRAAELALRLLAAGIPVSVSNDTVRDMVTNNEYKPENTKWIVWNAKLEKFLILFDQDDTLYSRASSLPGARWSTDYKSVAVPVSSYAAVMDFAKLYDFAISQVAQKQMDEQAIRMERAVVASPEIADPQRAPDALAEILTTSDAVLDDLRDDE